MRRKTTRGLLAILVALFVVSSFAAPAAAVLGSGSSGDGLSGTILSSGGDDSDGDDGSDSDTDDDGNEADGDDGSDSNDDSDADDGGNESETDDSTNESEFDDETETDESETDEGNETDDTAFEIDDEDEQTASNETDTDGNETTSADDEADDDRLLNRTRERISSTLNETGESELVGGTSELLSSGVPSVDETTESVGEESTQEVNETASQTVSIDLDARVHSLVKTDIKVDGMAFEVDYETELIQTNGTLSANADDSVSILHTTLDTVQRLSIVDTLLTEDISLAPGGTDDVSDVDDVDGIDDVETDATTSDNGSDDRFENGSNGESLALSAGGGDGGSLPAGHSGGVALGLGAFAAVVAARSTPLLAGVSTSSVGSLSSTAWSWLLDRLRPFVVPFRYSRYDGSDPLEHEARARVHDRIDETPGTYLSELSEETGLALSTVRHHIKVLEREGLISSAKLQGKRRFYPAYSDDIELTAALRDDSTAEILDSIARLGSASVSDLADELDRDPSTISHHLQRLEADEIIVREREGRSVMSRLSTEARTLIEPSVDADAAKSSELLAGGAD